ncbi:serpin family protein [Telmatocola sphagniphila]|uniref:Serpin family protein n=1 Tax=Telmatocola sphagniphila TaxID=1123043 RepID=A0A8E6ETY3_9BACT|nr:serpin family protein [Telmatocola sphagniphila]QVL33004.1 serpin family protein [Telmatocola sphagniphila]
MHRALIIMAIFGLTAGCAQSDAAETKAVVDSNTQFAFDLYAKLKDSKGNLFLSPFSISTALAMTSTGAREETLQQMMQVLHLRPGSNEGFAELLQKLNSADPKAYQLSVANSLFGQKGHPWLASFMQDTQKYYQAGLKEVDFVGNTEASRLEINKWVESKTNNKIQNLLAPGTVDSLTKLVLVNAIYFKGAWKKTFDPKLTQKADFSTSADHKVPTQLMVIKNEYSYFQNDDFQMVALPYSKDELSMVILLPKKVDGLNALEADLTGTKMTGWIGSMKPTKDVNVLLPKFKLESQFDLESTLAKMGMSDAFGPKSNLSGMDGTKNLVLTKVVHKSFVEVNEEGTEAAAASAAIVALRAMKPTAPPIFVRCDHPFLFMIRDNKSGSILFLGRLTEPK